MSEWLPVSHTAERSAEISAPPERIWAALTEVSAFPAWRPDVASVESLPFGGEWEYRVAPGRVTIVERGEIYSLFFRFMARFVFGYTRTIEAYLWALKRRVESQPS